MGILDFFKKMFETKSESNTGNGSSNHTHQEQSALIFNEAEKVYTLQTPGGHSFLLDDAQGSISLEDNHGNSIIMDKNGITFKSIADINLQAKNNVQINAGQDLTQECGKNMSLIVANDLTQECRKNMSLIASNDLKQECGKNMSLIAGNDLKQECGKNMSLIAGNEFIAEGSVGTKLSSSGITEIKGSLIQIN